jgi:EAL domain-containing protein (putative c-di-GMP-specific phosphodiesterase class I)
MILRDNAVRDSFDLIESGIQSDDMGAHALHNGLHLHSAFQPIFSLCHCRVVGYEGLLRAYTSQGADMPPYHVFANARSEPEIVHLDRLSRALHLRNFTLQQNRSDWLFLNINPRVIVQGKYYGSFFKDLLEHYQVPPSRIVVEIIEGAIEDEEQLSESVNFYKELGCLVAIDDFGAGHSNFERIWRLSPDIVKLDRSMILQASEKATARRVLPGIISLIHEAGSLALIEGVETKREAMIAMDTDVDLVQGYYFAEPAPGLMESARSKQIGKLFRDYSEVAPQITRRERLSAYSAEFAEAAARLQAGFTLVQACEGLLKIDGADRCYLLNQQGIQIGASLIASRRGNPMGDARYQPMADGTGANWVRRPYLQRALQHPRELQVTRPYLSIATGRLCVTVSMAIHVMGQLQVLCYDLDWGDK